MVGCEFCEQVFRRGTHNDNASRVPLWTSPRDDIRLFFEAIDLESIRRGYIGFQVAPVIGITVCLRYSYRDVKSVLKRLMRNEQLKADSTASVASSARTRFRFSSAGWKSRWITSPLKAISGWWIRSWLLLKRLGTGAGRSRDAGDRQDQCTDRNDDSVDFDG